MTLSSTIRIMGLREYLKYDELKGLKQSSLSEILAILVNSFIPKDYRKYVEFNVRYGDGCKRYAPGIPYFLKNRPKKIVEILLEYVQSSFKS